MSLKNVLHYIGCIGFSPNLNGGGVSRRTYLAMLISGSRPAKGIAGEGALPTVRSLDR
jgi:hypothetical protein